MVRHLVKSVLFTVPALLGILYYMICIFENDSHDE